MWYEAAINRSKLLHTSSVLERHTYELDLMRFLCPIKYEPLSWVWVFFFFLKSTTDLLRVCPTVSLHHNHSSMALTGTEADYSVILETQHFPLGSSAFTLGPNADSGLLHQLTIIAPIQNFISLQIKIFMYEPMSVVCSWMHVCIMQIWWLYEGVYVWIYKTCNTWIIM